MKRQACLSMSFIEQKFLFTTFSLFIGLVLVSNAASAQQSIELNSSSYTGTVPNGPTVVSQTANFKQNTTGNTFVSLTNPVSVTASFSNQQYTTVPGSPAGMMFGATINGANGSTPGSTGVFMIMNAKGSASNSSFTSNPYGTAGTGIDVAQNYSFEFFNTFAMWNGTSGPAGKRAYYGNITFTFSRPVSDPVIHFGDLGANQTSNSASTEFELPAGSGVSLTKLSGTSELSIPSSNDKILNSASTPAAGCGSGAACGSVIINGTNITAVTFRVYVRFRTTSFDSPGNDVDGDAFMVGFSFTAFNISGNAYNDSNGLNDNAVNGTGSNAGNRLYALAVDAYNNVQGSAIVTAGGSFSFTNLVKGPYTVRLSESSATLGSAAPSASLPPGWINTGEFRGVGTGSDGRVDGNLTDNVGTSNIANFNFGIERKPIAYDILYQVASRPAVNSILVLNGSVGIPAVGNKPTRPNGNDAEDGPLESGDTIVISTLPVNSTLLYNNIPVETGQAITGLNPDLLAVKFTGAGYSMVNFTYKYKDAAGVESSPALYSLFWSGIPLPVDLISFTVNKEQGNNILLKWQTSSELDNKGFNVQHSIDGQNWTTLTFVDKKAGMNGGAMYNYTHNEAGSGMHYYRLQQMDFNGLHKFSAVQKINIVIDHLVQTYPNPAKDVLFVNRNSTDTNPVELKLYNSNGALVMTQMDIKKGVLLNIRCLPAGVYVLMVMSENGRQQSKKIIKQ